MKKSYGLLLFQGFDLKNILFCYNSINAVTSREPEFGAWQTLDLSRYIMSSLRFSSAWFSFMIMVKLKGLELAV